MGGPGSGRRPRLVLAGGGNNQPACAAGCSLSAAPATPDDLYRRIIYPLVAVEDGIGAVVCSKQDESGTSYRTLALCELRKPKRGQGVRVAMMRYEVGEEGLAGTARVISGTVEAVSPEPVDGFCLAAVRLRDEVKYEYTYRLYDPAVHREVRPLDTVYCITPDEEWTFAIQQSIITHLNAPARTGTGIGIAATPGWKPGEVSLVVRPAAEPILLGFFHHPWPVIKEFVQDAGLAV